MVRVRIDNVLRNTRKRVMMDVLLTGWPMVSVSVSLCE